MLFSSLCSLCIQCRGATSFVPLHVVVCSPFSHNCVHRVPVDCISISILPAGHKLWHYWALGSSTLSLMQWLFTLAHNLTQNFNLSVGTNARAISKCILYSCHVHLELALVRPSSHTKSNVIFAVFERTSRTNCHRNQAKIFQMTHNYSDDNDDDGCFGGSMQINQQVSFHQVSFLDNFGKRTEETVCVISTHRKK